MKQTYSSKKAQQFSWLVVWLGFMAYEPLLVI